MFFSWKSALVAVGQAPPILPKHHAGAATAPRPYQWWCQRFSRVVSRPKWQNSAWCTICRRTLKITSAHTSEHPKFAHKQALLCRLRLDYFTSHTAACACRLVLIVAKFALHRKKSAAAFKAGTAHAHLNGQNSRINTPRRAKCR